MPAYIINPDLIIIDSTLPKYSGRELVEYIISNKKFNDTPIILLQENEKLLTDLSDNFIQISKRNQNFPRNLIEKAISVLNISHDLNQQLSSRTSKILNFLGKRIIRYSNFSNIRSHKIRHVNVLLKPFYFLGYIFDQLLASIYLTFFYILLRKKDKESNIEQKEKDLENYRRKIYPSIAVGIAAILFVCLQIIFALGGVLTLTFLGSKVVHAATITWDEGGETNNWSDCENWVGDICPTSADVVQFNNTSQKDSVIDEAFGGEILQISIPGGYNGTITLERSITVGINGFNQASGTFNSGDHVIDINASFSLTGGTFNAPTTLLRVARHFTVNGGTFNHSNGTLELKSGIGDVMTCVDTTFNLVTITGGSSRTINSSCNLPLGDNPTVAGGTITLNGTLSGSGSLNISGSLTLNNSAANLSGFTSILVTSSFNVQNGANVNLGDYSSGVFNAITIASNADTISLPSNTDIDGGLTINGGTFNAPSDNMTLAGGLNITGGTFNHNNGTVTFDGTTTATLSCNNAIFNHIVFAHTGSTKTVSSNCTLPLGHNPNLSTAVTLNGTLTGTGTITGPSGLNLNTGSVLSGFTGLNGTVLSISGGEVDFSSYTTFSINSNTTLSSGSLTLPDGADLNGNLIITGGTFTAPSGSMTLAGNLTVSGSPTFNHNNGTIIFDGAGGNYSCNDVVFNLIVFDKSPGTSTVGSNCNFPIGNNPIIQGPSSNIILDGALSGSGTLTMGNGSVLTFRNEFSSLSGFNGLSVNQMVINGATIDLSSYDTFTASSNICVGGISISCTTATSGTLYLPNGADLDGSLIISSGTFNAPSGEMTIARALTINGGTFIHNNGTIIFDGSGTTVQITCNNAEFNHVVFAHTANTKIIDSSCTLPLGHDPVVSRQISVFGTITGSGLLTIPIGPSTFNAGAQVIGFEAYEGGSITVSGADLDFSGYTSFSTTSNITLSSGSISLPPDSNIDGALTISGGTFNAPSGEMTVGGNLTISGTPEFNHNNGTIIFDGNSTAILNCNGVTFNLVRIEHTNGTKTINSNCILPLGDNPFIGNGPGTNLSLATTLSGTITGTGLLTNNGFLNVSSTGVLLGFEGLVVTGNFNLTGGTQDFSSYIPFQVDRDFIIQDSATFIAPSETMKVGDEFANFGTFNHNNGTVELISDGTQGSQVIQGSSTFYNLVKTAEVPSDLPLQFTDGTTQTVINGLILKGSSAYPLKVGSSLSGIQWNINPQGTVEIEHLDVQDSNNIGPVIQAAGKNITNSGNNTGWNFDNPTVTNIGPANLTNGSYINNNKPTINFVITDPNPSETVKYNIQIDNNSDFSTSEVNYISELEAQGNKTFTVLTALQDGNYYIRIKGIDSLGGDGGFILVNNGNRAFSIDTSSPAGLIAIGKNTQSSNPRDVYLIFQAVDSFSGVSEMIYSENGNFSGSNWVPYKSVVITP